MPVLATSLSGVEGMGVREHLVKYLRAEEAGAEGTEEEKSGDSLSPQQRVKALQQTVVRLTGLETDENKLTVIAFLEDLLKSCEEP